MKECSFLSFHSLSKKMAMSFICHGSKRMKFSHCLRNVPWVGCRTTSRLITTSIVFPSNFLNIFQFGMPLVSTDLVNIQYLKPLLSHRENTEELIEQKGIGQNHSTWNRQNKSFFERQTKGGWQETLDFKPSQCLIREVLNGES